MRTHTLLHHTHAGNAGLHTHTGDNCTVAAIGDDPQAALVIHLARCVRFQAKTYASYSFHARYDIYTYIHISYTHKSVFVYISIFMRSYFVIVINAISAPYDSCTCRRSNCIAQNDADSLMWGHLSAKHLWESKYLYTKIKIKMKMK